LARPARVFTSELEALSMMLMPEIARAATFLIEVPLVRVLIWV
jgi:hypothetical protein